ncbi:family 43 glycosylhydrolase [Serratia proteamaculans]|uniref:Family 43 glycosylhydrolase n=1 Tax=Serratia proteamaculans TaxID=28151 RepID=A0A7U0N2G5_SERPR|nr:family 43 glycosylhydrolase [Serratia proteamaculans]MBO1502536.1 family 43 glycosylhydrolase [Serratia proteamaculans]MDW5510928.1 family 43 glycosylhydrolase [Serratia proteamaculans]QQX51356.1 family 43 glycosylhydrolase [Serratia proteamaculans]CAI1969289.1 Alpha-N-arabinofuranosidase 2 precursor [Serratia proteamaculans]
MRDYPNPLIEQRADPFVLRHSDGYYYFTASVPEYDRLELRRARSINELSQASPTVVWQKPQQGPMSHLIWAPELHFINGKWYLYFAAAHSPEIADGLFQHRMFALECSAANPLTGDWVEKGRIYTHIDSFSLDATHFEHRGKHYYLWAQKDPAIHGNSNLYLAEMANPWTLKGQPVMLSQPELPWETVGFSVNEGPAVITHGQKIFISYSASATDENYCLGLLWADIDSDITDATQWHKLGQPLFRTSVKNRQFGPGHNSFTLDEQGQDLLVYHARNYTEIEGDPLYDPNRHTRIKSLGWDEEGMPVLGEPPADNR